MRRTTTVLLLVILASSLPGPDTLRAQATARLDEDLAVLAEFRPGYTFWSLIYTIPDGSVVYGSAMDGRLLATFPSNGDWTRDANWADSTLAAVLRGRSLPRRLTDRRDEVAEVLDGAVGPVVHNPTRGNFVTPNVKRFGSFLEEWSRIYERFGVPAELGLAQAVVESGLSGTVKSEARAVGFCQWLPRNWDRLQGLTANVIEVQNQTTQAAFCAAYLSVLATKYGSFIPALSEHHAGAANVGRAVINGHRLGAEDMRQRYFMGSQFALDLRELSPRTFRDLLGTYGPRSYRYAEMVFVNMSTVASLRASNQQQGIYAIRVTRDVPLTEIAQKSGLSQNEVKRFNPALIRRVPKGATLYLPTMIEEFGEDVSYWHRPAPDAYTAVMSDFLRLTFSREQWEASNFEPVLSEYHRRFTATDCEEGRIMAAAISYALQEVPGTRRVLDEFRTSPKIDRLFEEGVELWTSDPATPR